MDTRGQREARVKLDPLRLEEPVQTLVLRRAEFERLRRSYPTKRASPR